MQRDPSAYLAEQQRKSTGDTATEWGKIEELYNKKLWHQLTLALLTFVKQPCFQQGDSLIQLYDNFIADFDHRIKKLSLAELSIVIVKQIKDPKDAIAYLEKIKEKVKGSDDATVLIMTYIGNILLLQNDLPATKGIVEDAQVLLEGIDGITSVHGGFYDLSSNYYKMQGNHASYYRDALRYLGCVPITDIPESERVERAFNLSLAALLGKGVYNFGELLAHEVLESLKGTDKNWLVDLLYAFNSGNLTKFDALKSKWSAQPDLVAAQLELRQKITLLCLMEMTFKRPANDRRLKFDEIAKASKLPIDEVELLVMKALSLKLVKGTIDQVEQFVQMNWVQPRVLDKEQIGHMQKNLDQWISDVKSMENLVEVKAQDILT